MEKVTELNTKQKMLSFAFLADITSGVVFDVESDSDLQTTQQEFERELQNTLNNIITDSEIESYLGGGWSCNNYPWVDIEKDPRDIYLARNTTTIFINGNEVVIAVAGTNFVENYDWFTEDLGVVEQKPWVEVVNSLSGTKIKETEESLGVISKGTVTALTKTWLQNGAISDKNLINELKDIVSSMNEINLTVTGHSLGGAITPVLAQALWELRAEWMPTSSTITVTAYPFAGPTVGNQEFVDYVQSKDKNMVENKIQLISTYNTKDVVPHGWNLDMMNQMHNLFVDVVPDANIDENGALIKSTIEWLIGKSKHSTQNDNYVRWNHEDTFDGSFPDKATIEGEAIAFAKILKDKLNSKENLDTKNAMQKICGIKELSDKIEVDKFYNCLVYLCKYLLMLKREHIKEYPVNIYDTNHNPNNKHFHDRIKKLTKDAKSKWNTKEDGEAGMAVLKQLFIDVAGDI